MAPWRWIAALLPAALAIAGQLGAFVGLPPTDLGVHNGLLKAPSTRPQSVSSQAVRWADHPQAQAAQIEPIALGPQPALAFDALVQVLAAQPRTRILERSDGYVRAESRTLVLGFVDDMELWLDSALGVAQVRSASRLGHGDLGTNRRRVEALRAAFENSQRS